MEILNSIWTTLTTENEGVTKLLLIPLGLIETLVSMLLFTQVLNIKTTFKKKIIYVFLTTTFFTTTNQFIPSPFSLFLTFILYPVFIYYIFDTTVIKAILGEILPILLIALFETLIFKFYLSAFNLIYTDLVYIPIYRVSASLLIYFIIFILYFVCYKLNLNINIFDNFSKNRKRIIIIDLIFGIISIGLQFYVVGFYIQNLPIYITLLSSLSLITYFFVSLYTINKISNLELTERNLEESQLYNKTLQILHDNVRAFRHDFSNILAGIGGYVQTKDMEGLEKYYSQLLIDFQSTNNLTTLSPNLVNNPAIYNVLANKYHKADEKGIKIELSIFYDFNKLNIKIYELTRILGILLDNAIEAAAECDKKIINLIVRDEPNRNRQVILIENTYANKDVNTEAIYEKGVTSKKGNTGLGLWQVRQMMKKNGNLNLYTSKNDEYFSQALEIYN